MTQNFIWEFQEGGKVWNKYTPKLNYEMEKAFNDFQNLGTALFLLDKQWTIDFGKNTQTNQKTKKIRSIRRTHFSNPPKPYNKFVFVPTTNTGGSPSSSPSSSSAFFDTEESNSYSPASVVTRTTNYGWKLIITKDSSDSITISLAEPPQPQIGTNNNSLFDEDTNQSPDPQQTQQQPTTSNSFEQKKQIAQSLTKYVKVNYEEEKNKGIEFLEIMKKKEEEEKKNKSQKKEKGSPSPKQEKKDDNATVQTYFSESEICTICQFAFKEEPNDIVLLPKCGHYFHEDCLVSSLDCNSHDFFRCPICGYIYGVRIGTMPYGTMSIHKDHHMHCDGYSNVGTFSINYNFPDGTQGKEHPQPNSYYSGTSRTAYLPMNEDGTKICRMLQIAFKRRLNFTVGRSITNSTDNTTVWAVHHKTTTTGGSTNFGFPDKSYFNRVEEELVMKGVTADDITDEEKLL